MPRRSSILIAVLACFGSCFAAPASAQLWTAGDFNGDSRPDIAVLDRGARTATPVLLTAAPSSATGSFDWPGSLTSSLTTRDVDSDRDPDLVLRSHAGRPLRLWLNDGAGRFVEVLPSEHFSSSTPPPDHWLASFAHKLHRQSLNRNPINRLAVSPSAGTSPAAPPCFPVCPNLATSAATSLLLSASPLRGPPFPPGTHL